MKKSMFLIMAGILAISFAACGSKATDTQDSNVTSTPEDTGEDTGDSSETPETTETPAGKTIKIGMSMANNDDFTTQLEALYRKYADEVGGIELTIINAQSDANKQMDDVESLIANEMDVIVLRAVDMDAAIPAAEAVKDAGIYLVIDGTALETEEYDVFVTSEQEEHGRMLGTYLQGILDENPGLELKMGYIYGVISPVIEGRRSGIFETCPSVEEVVNGVGDWSADKAMALAEDWLLAYPEINVIACANDEMAGGVIQAVNAAGKAGEIYVLGVDGTEQGQAYIRSGELAASTLQKIDVQADSIIEICVGLMEGKTYDKTVNLEMLALLSADTIDTVVGVE